MEERDWASLAPELLTQVLQRVQKGADERGEGRRMVALSGVCRSWRHQVQQEWQAQSTLRLLVFPAAIRQVIFCGRPLQCLLRKKGNVFTLFQNCGRDGDRYFLMVARKRWRPSCTYFDVSTDPRSLTKGHAHLGRLISNIWRSEFVLAESKETRIARSGRAAWKAVPVLGVRFGEDIVDGVRQRKLSCHLLPSLRFSLLEPCPLIALEEQLVATARRSFLRWSCLSPPEYDWSQTYSSLKDDGEIPEDVEVVGDLYGGEGLSGASRSETVSFVSKVPAWDGRQQCWSLDFKGRATMASMHNFQLVSAAASEPRLETIFLQLGKVGKGLFTLDFCYPLSAFEAFSVCLGSFATRVGLEP